MQLSLSIENIQQQNVSSSMTMHSFLGMHGLLNKSSDKIIKQDFLDSQEMARNQSGSCENNQVSQRNEFGMNE